MFIIAVNLVMFLLLVIVTRQEHEKSILKAGKKHKEKI